VLRTPVTLFKKQFALQSGRSGSASAAANANVTVELWGKHVDCHSLAAQKVYMKSDKESLLSVSRAAMRLHEVPGIAGRADDVPAGDPKGAGTQEEEDMRTYDESAGSPQVAAEADLPPEVVRVPQGAF
jgi:hypothetical protein